MYEIADLAESPDVEYPAMPPKHGSQSQLNPSNAARSTASYASLSYNGKVYHQCSSPLSASLEGVVNRE